MITTARRLAGMVRVILHLLRSALTMALVMPWVGPQRRTRIVRNWCQAVLDLFRLDLAVTGTPACQTTAARPVLLVGNHISWIDIYAYMSVMDVRFVAKSEVGGWPLIGWFARRLGTIFVTRDSRRDAARAGSEIGRALGGGAAVCVFPEGTTTDGSVVLPFSGVLLQPAVETRALVQPVAIAYRDAEGRRSPRMAFIGEETLVASIWSLVVGERTLIELHFLEPVASDGRSRRQLAGECELAVRTALGLVTPTPAVPAQARSVTSGVALAAFPGH
ncbi:MAG: lysophospholipid acyltransferase family protein [Hyphomicrobiaceae bacterium]